MRGAVGAKVSASASHVQDGQEWGFFSVVIRGSDAESKQAHSAQDGAFDRLRQLRACSGGVFFAGLTRSRRAPSHGESDAASDWRQAGERSGASVQALMASSDIDCAHARGDS